MNKRLLQIGIVVIASVIPSYVFAEVEKIVAAFNHNMKITINGKDFVPKDETGNDIEPIIYKGRTYLPLRAISAELGANVQWNSKTNTIEISSESDKNIGIPFKDGLSNEIKPLSSPLPTTPVIEESRKQKLETKATAPKQAPQAKKLSSPETNALKDNPEYPNLSFQKDQSLGNEELDKAIKAKVAQTFESVSSGKLLEKGDFEGLVYPDSPASKRIFESIQYIQNKNLKLSMVVDNLEIVGVFANEKGEIVACNLRGSLNMITAEGKKTSSRQLFSLANKNGDWLLYKYSE